MTGPADQPTPDDLEWLLLGAPRRYTREDVAEAAGVSVDEARGYWRALGFPDVGHAVAFTAWDKEALEGVLGLVRTGAIDEPTAIQLVRALGRMTGRLAEWDVEVVTGILERDEADGNGSESRIAAAYDLFARLLPELERLLIYAWRRKLAASSTRLAALAELGGSPLTAPASVGFADIVSFTRMSRGLSSEALGELVERFEATTNDVIFGAGGRVVKTLGDEVVFVADAAAVAAAIGCDLVEAIGRKPDLPDIRVGIATGPVVARMGDVFGTPTNLAARLTALADRNVVLVDPATAEALADEPGMALRALPSTFLHGIGSVTAFSVDRRR